MKKRWSGTLALLALAVAGPAAMAAVEKDPVANPDFAASVSKTTTELEEVIVSGRLDRLSAVVKAIDDAEDRFLNRYNELNDDWLYDVKCIRQARTGQRVPVRQCEPNFIAEAKREAAVYGLLRTGNVTDWANRTQTIYQWGQPELQKHMKALVEADEDLQRALVERQLLVERYQKLRKQKFEGRWIVWD